MPPTTTTPTQWTILIFFDIFAKTWQIKLNGITRTPRISDFDLLLCIRKVDWATIHFFRSFVKSLAKQFVRTGTQILNIFCHQELIWKLSKKGDSPFSKHNKKMSFEHFSNCGIFWSCFDQYLPKTIWTNPNCPFIWNYFSFYHNFLQSSKFEYYLACHISDATSCNTLLHARNAQWSLIYFEVVLQHNQK